MNMITVALLSSVDLCKAGYHGSMDLVEATGKALHALNHVNSGICQKLKESTVPSPIVIRYSIVFKRWLLPMGSEEI